MPAFVSETQIAPSLLDRREKLFSPAALAKTINVPGHRGGAHLNGSTLFRHIVKGVRAANGELVRLEAVRVGSRWLSSVEAFGRFTERLTAASIAPGTPSVTPVPTPAARTRTAAKASREADKIFGTT